MYMELFLRKVCLLDIMIHIISTLVEGCFPFTWKANVIHLLEADWSVEPFVLLLFGVQWLFDEASFPL